MGEGRRARRIYRDELVPGSLWLHEDENYPWLDVVIRELNGENAVLAFTVYFWGDESWDTNSFHVENAVSLRRVA